MNKKFTIDESDKVTVKIIKNRYMDFLKDPNVVGVAVGRKIRDGKVTDEPCITFFVAKKIVNEKKILPEFLLPQTLEEDAVEVQSDVVETGHIYAYAAHTSRERPAVPGASIGHVDVTAGTLGAIVIDDKSKTQVILSNNHVLADSNRASTNDDILQPGKADGGTVPNDVIGNLLRFKTIDFAGGTNYIDAAICSVKKPNYISNTPHDGIPAPSPKTQAVGLLFAGSSTQTIINPIGIVLNELKISLPAGSTIEGSIGMNVQKTGRTTGGTTNTIKNINATVRVNYGSAGEAVFSDQIVTGDMSDGGDSGSLVVKGGAGAPDEPPDKPPTKPGPCPCGIFALVDPQLDYTTSKIVFNAFKAKRLAKKELKNKKQ